MRLKQFHVSICNCQKWRLADLDDLFVHIHGSDWYHRNIRLYGTALLLQPFDSVTLDHSMKVLTGLLF